jgi:hypothetical protein
MKAEKALGKCLLPHAKHVEEAILAFLLTPASVYL